MNYTGFQLDAFLTCAFQEEANAGEFEEEPRLIWGAVSGSAAYAALADYFYRQDRRLRDSRDEEAILEEQEAARAELERVERAAQEARDAERAARELEAVREAVAAESLAFADFYRRLLDEAIAKIREAEALRIAEELAAAQAVEAERMRMALEIAEIERQALEQDDEEVMLLMAAM